MTPSPPAPSGTVILDTNVISELMLETPDAHVQEWVREISPDLVCTTSVTLAEVRFGIARLPAGRRRALLGAAADDVFGTFADRVLPFDAAAANAYADVVVEREQAGEPITGFDAQIAAICRVHRAALATRNTSDFTRLGLQMRPQTLTPRESDVLELAANRCPGRGDRHPCGPVAGHGAQLPPQRSASWGEQPT